MQHNMTKHPRAKKETFGCFRMNNQDALDVFVMNMYQSKQETFDLQIPEYFF